MDDEYDETGAEHGSYADAELPAEQILKRNVATMLLIDMDSAAKIIQEMNEPQHYNSRMQMDHNKKFVVDLEKKLFKIISGALSVCISQGVGFPKEELEQFKNGDYDALQRLRARILEALPERQKIIHEKTITMYPQKTTQVA